LEPIIEAAQEADVAKTIFDSFIVGVYEVEATDLLFLSSESE
jgi:hypothetical protein